MPPCPEEISTEAAKRQLAAVQCPDVSIPLERLLIVGEPANAILQVAADTRSDFIVMGTRGRSGLARLLMGSVAEWVLRNATCPVVTVKGPAAQATTEPVAKPSTSVTIY